MFRNWLQWSIQTLRKVFPNGPYRDAPSRLVKCEIFVIFVLCAASETVVVTGEWRQNVQELAAMEHTNP